MTTPKWLSLDVVLAIHDEQMALFGGGEGLRDQALLESALARPRNRHAYDRGASLFELAMLYCAGIVKNHPFVDGNKRTGLLCIQAFLFLNGWRFEPDQAKEVEMILDLAAGKIAEAELAAWIRMGATAANSTTAAARRNFPQDPCVRQSLPAEGACRSL